MQHRMLLAGKVHLPPMDRSTARLATTGASLDLLPR